MSDDDHRLDFDLDAEQPSTVGGRLRRVSGTIRVGVGRVRGRIVGPTPGRTIFCLFGVAVAVALMVTVTGIAIGLTTHATVESEDVDYWIVPEENTAESMVVEASGVSIGDVHATTERLRADDRIEYATPVQIQVLQLSGSAGTEEYVLAVGIIPPEDGRSVAGVSTDALSAEYPHYADGSYDGEWTGEAIATEATLDVLDAGVGDSLAVSTGGDRSFTVVGVDEGGVESGFGPVPVVVVHLAELQTVTGTATHDQADQILVSTTDPGVESTLEGIYPRTSVVSRAGLGGPELSPDDLSVAVGLSAFVVAVAVGTLFVATMMGLEMTADRRRLATLSTLGVSARSRGLLVAVETVTVAFLGGVIGLLLGRIAVAAVNGVAGAYVGTESLAVYPPWLIGYGVGVAVLIGLLASPYPVWLSRRTANVSEVLR